MSTVGEAMVRAPKIGHRGTSVREAEEFFLDDHVHALPIVERGVLTSMVERTDLVGLAPDLPVRLAGRLEERVIGPDVALDVAWTSMLASGRRRLAVTGEAGVLLGLLCLKRHGRGFCSDEGVRARAAERAAGQVATP